VKERLLMEATEQGDHCVHRVKRLVRWFDARGDVPDEFAQFDRHMGVGVITVR
jgi:hypothetical protein